MLDIKINFTIKGEIVSDTTCLSNIFFKNSHVLNGNLHFQYNTQLSFQQPATLMFEKFSFEQVNR